MLLSSACGSDDSSSPADNNPGGSGGSAGSGGIGGGGTGGEHVDAIDVPTDPACENINHRNCMLPFPSDRWLVENADTPTGFAVAYDPKAIPAATSGKLFDVSPFERLDGVSPNSQIVTLFDEPADLTGLAFHDSIERSLEESALVALIDLETGERVAHWLENDARAEAADETLLYIHPASRLKANHEYAVAIGGLNGASGAALETSPAFAALRDNVPTTSTSVEKRRASFDALFSALEEAGIERDSLLEAWQFRTGSDENIRQTLLAMRSDALSRLGDDGIGCTITDVEDDFQGISARRVLGTITVPWYMDADLAPSKLVRGDDDAPVFAKNHEVEFTAIVPKSLASSEETGSLVTWGHGLFGEGKGTISSTSLLQVAEANQSVMVAMDWHGMSKKDLPFLATALGDTSKFYMVGENLEQGMINMIALTRTLLGTCRSRPEFLSDSGKELIDPDRPYYVGGSQGSILGGPLLALSPDYERGALIVGGAGYSFMIERSTHFNTFEALMKPSYDSRLSRALLMVLSQHVWDTSETGSWIEVASKGGSGIEPKPFLYLVAQNDAQVANLSSDIAVRTAGIPVMSESVIKPWGVPVVEAPYQGSAYVAFNVGDRDVPTGNLSPEADDGGHGSVGLTSEAQEMIMHFLETGEVISTCGGLCDLTQ
jgi:hypothetical protein